MSDQYETVGQRASYGIGRQMGSQLASQPFDGLDAAAVAAGVTDVLTGKSSALSEDEIHAAFAEIEKQMQQQASQHGQVAAREGEAFLKQNAERDTVTVLESGLQYEILTEADQEVPDDLRELAEEHERIKEREAEARQRFGSGGRGNNFHPGNVFTKWLLAGQY